MDKGKKIIRNNQSESAHSAWRGNIGFSLIVALAASMTVSLYPIGMFLLNNQGEFWFRITDVMGTVVILFGVIAVVLFLVMAVFSGQRMSSVQLGIAAIMTAIGACYYIQSNFMVSYLPLLTGDDIDWSGFGLWGVLSPVLWISVPLIFLVLLFTNKKLLRNTVSVISVILLAMEVLTLGMTIVTTPITRPEDKAAYFSDEGLYELSSKENIVMIVSDTFEGTYMNDILALYPEWKERLVDFTYYDNTTGTSCFTYFSFAKLLTGVDFPIGKNLENGIAEAFDQQTLVDKVIRHGYDVAYYAAFTPTAAIDGKIINYEGDYLEPTTEVKRNLMKLLGKSTLFQGVPHQLKKHFIVLNGDYNQLRLQTVDSDKAAPYVVNDTTYREALLEYGMTAVDAPPRYVVYELHGIHAPYTLNREFETVQFSENMSLRDKQLEGALAALKLLTEYVDALKRAGLYDNTTIILTADHGFDMRFYPVMLVKEAGTATGEKLKVNSAPISFQDDYEIILNEMTAGKSFSKAIEKLNLAPDRTRHALNFRSKDGYGKDTNVRSVVNIIGHASLEESYSSIKDEFYKNSDFAGRYTLGSIITHSDHTENVAIYGFRNNGQIYLHSAYLDAYLDAPGKPLTYEVAVQNITSIQQRLVVSVEEKVVEEITFQPYASQTVNIKIPAESAEDQCVSLGFEAPDATLIHGTIETLGWSEYYSFAFGEGTIK